MASGLDDLRELKRIAKELGKETKINDYIDALKNSNDVVNKEVAVLLKEFRAEGDPLLKAVLDFTNHLDTKNIVEQAQEKQGQEKEEQERLEKEIRDEVHQHNDAIVELLKDRKKELEEKTTPAQEQEGRKSLFSMKRPPLRDKNTVDETRSKYLKAIDCLLLEASRYQSGGDQRDEPVTINALIQGASAAVSAVQFNNTEKSPVDVLKDIYKINETQGIRTVLIDKVVGVKLNEFTDGISMESSGIKGKSKFAKLVDNVKEKHKQYLGHDIEPVKDKKRTRPGGG